MFSVKILWSLLWMRDWAVISVCFSKFRFSISIFLIIVFEMIIISLTRMKSLDSILLIILWYILKWPLYFFFFFFKNSLRPSAGETSCSNWLGLMLTKQSQQRWYCAAGERAVPDRADQALPEVPVVRQCAHHPEEVWWSN